MDKLDINCGISMWSDMTVRQIDSHMDVRGVDVISEIHKRMDDEFEKMRTEMDKVIVNDVLEISNQEREFIWIQ